MKAAAQAASAAKAPLPPAAESTRPFATYYYGSAKDRDSDWSRIGRAASLRGAIRAATLHLFDSHYGFAIIHGLSGEVVARVARGPKSITISGVFDAQLTH